MVACYPCEERRELTDENWKLLAENAALKSAIASLYPAIEHGDEQHREWLKTKINEHFGLGK